MSKAYNVKATPLARATTSTMATGKKQIKFRATMTVRGKLVERTIIAQGAAADLVKGMIKKGQEVALRVLFERAPANDDSKRGGEYCSIVALPRVAAAA